MERHCETGYLPTIWWSVEKYYEPSFLRNERRIIEEQLQQTIRNVEGGLRIQPQGFISQERQNEKWTVDPFWGVDRSQQKNCSTKTNTEPLHAMSRITRNTFRWKKEESVHTRTKPLNPGSPGSQLDKIRGRQNCQVCKDGPRFEDIRRTK